MAIHILGIRHHGVGSAKNVKEALHSLRPDIILIEGPPEAEAILSWVSHKDMKPPVAMLAYHVDHPKQAVFYPFAVFSPEWQALHYGAHQQVPVRMMDLPLSHQFALKSVKKPREWVLHPAPEEMDADEKNLPEAFIPEVHDPLAALSTIAGYSDRELWWEHHFEQKYLNGECSSHFEAIMTAIEVLREPGRDDVKWSGQDRDDLREAYMRRIIRQAVREGYQNIVIVCGAWHAPALRDTDRTETADETLLKGLPKVKVNTSWVPWTNSRLSWNSGYGAGIESPGWYEHVWYHPHDGGIRWLTRVAKLFRTKKMDVSTAHVIEAFRLAQALAGLRSLSRPGLLEFNEATQSVICGGDKVLLKLVEEELIVARNIGQVPRDLPKHPLQSDFELYQKKFRLECGEQRKEYELDLRKALDLNRSKFLHRAEMLGIGWGTKYLAGSKGTFKEMWALRWEPEIMIRLMDQSIWGNTVEEACARFVLDACQKADAITEVAELIQKAIPAELFEVVDQMLIRIHELATLSSDIPDLMRALSPLVEVSRYGNVRKTDQGAVNQLVEGLITRICIGLPNACYGLDDNSANRMFENIKKADEAVRLLENRLLEESWYQSLAVLLDKPFINPLITGCTCRLLFDAKRMAEEETARLFGLALSAGNEPGYAAGWLEGFLKGSGMILLYDHVLWSILNKWITELETTQFVELLPILRRTFSRFETGERHQLGAKAKRGLESGDKDPFRDPAERDIHFNPERAEEALPVVKLLLGFS
jgi:hypothetical protein